MTHNPSLRYWIMVSVTLVIVVAMSYGFALAGEPQSVWIWRDVLGVIR